MNRYVLAVLLMLSGTGCDRSPDAPRQNENEAAVVGYAWYRVRRFHDDSLHVTCWTHGESISCLPDAQLVRQ